MNSNKFSHLLTFFISFSFWIILLITSFNILLSLITVFDLLLIETFHYDNLDYKFTDYPKFINHLLSRNMNDNDSINTIDYESLPSPSHSNFNCFTIKTLNIKATVQDIKYSLKHTTDIVVHKFKVMDRTLVWFFKGSKPGGGRGL